MSNMNFWILALLLPAQIVMYFAAGQVYFSYLKSKKQLKNISTFKLMRIALEINFANHVLPSGGVSGMGYLAWRLRDYHVTGGQATMMQFVRYGLVAVASAIYTLMAAVILAFMGVEFWIVLFSVGVAVIMCVVVVVFFIILSSKKRTSWVGKWLRIILNKIVYIVTFKKVPSLLKQKAVDKFLRDLHHDFNLIIKDRRMLIRPFLWTMLYSIIDSGTFLITFYALGYPVNFAPIIIAQVMSSIIGTFVFTPGGSGFYEIAMYKYYAATGIVESYAIAATIVTRVIVIIGTIISGWGFYQLALLRSKDKRLDIGDGQELKAKSK